MLATEFIAKKRDGGEITLAEFREFFAPYLTGHVTDYQVSAFLMAAYLKGLNQNETAALTQTIHKSGHSFAWGSEAGRVVDKHSTGGVGDKTSFVILPLVALAGGLVPMISGRGLGHTGGTLDKLESIPGLNVRLSVTEAQKITLEHGGVFVGQTSELAPLDGRLYALRDVTATVTSVPLITASILGKKLSEGLNALVLDVKYGSGALIADPLKATELARSLTEVAKICGLKANALITSMNSPLGRFAGNRLEIFEIVEILKGQGNTDVRDLSLELAARMVQSFDPLRSHAAILDQLTSYLLNGQAYEKFCAIIKAQGADPRVLEIENFYFGSRIRKDIFLDGQGYVEAIDVRKVGMALVLLGGGRERQEDTIDTQVGFGKLAHVGEYLDGQTPVAEVFGNDPERVALASRWLQEAYKLGPNKVVENRILSRVE